ncbi:MAG: LON peptidase substrate-binding domain-containing protein [Cloacibacillus evryensis]
MRSILREFEQNVHLDPKLPEEIARSVRDIDAPDVLCDVVASHSHLDITEKQKILETSVTEDRLSLLLKMLITENELLGLERDLEDRVRSEIDKDQHNYYLREQQGHQRRAGEDSPPRGGGTARRRGRVGDAESVMERVNKRDIKVHQACPLSRRRPPSRTYIETLAELPWNSSTEDCLRTCQRAQGPRRGSLWPRRCENASLNTSPSKSGREKACARR